MIYKVVYVAEKDGFRLGVHAMAKLMSEEKKKDWGEASGYRQYLQKRNLDIQLKFRNGVTIGQLAEEYCLSHDTIKKIAYSKKEVFVMDYKCLSKTTVTIGMRRITGLA